MTDRETACTREGLDLAVIGMSGQFPGAKNLSEFWRNLRDGVESIRFFTDEELTSFGVDPSVLKLPNFVKAGAVFDDISLFDADFFGYSPREAELMDPQHRIFLECAWAALEDAGYNAGAFGGLIGVYAGMSLSTYLLYNLLGSPQHSKPEDHFQIMIGSDKDFLSTRVSYHLDLKGPSIDVQTGCSTSLVAVHLACQSLLSYQCDLALAGGVSLQVPQRTGYFYQEGSLYSPDGHCRAFDSLAQGTLFGQGVGVVVLRRLEDALTDGDHILAVIKASAVNNDGACKIGYVAPSVDGQAQVIIAAQALAGVKAETITYVEAHGTGTALGDPMEITALSKAFRASAEAKQFCAIGSVKTNIGHIDAAAGIAGLIKTVLALKHRQLPPSLHFQQPNPKIDFANSPFYVNAVLSAWEGRGAPLRAGVSSFGIGGTNSHVILEEAPPREPSGSFRPWHLLTLSSKTPSALQTATANLADHLRTQADLNLADVAFTLAVGRKEFDYRRMIVCRDREDAVGALAEDSPRVFTRRQQARERPVVFMFPGGGAQYVNMGLDLYRSEPAFREEVGNCCQILRSELGYDLRERLYPGPESDGAERMKRTAVGLPALFVVEYAMARLLMSWGIEPEAMIGHSLGEYVAACLAGVFGLEEALSLVALRSRLFERLPEGGMLSIPLPESQVRGLMNGKLSLAAVNGPSQCVVSGPVEAIEEMADTLSERELEFRRVQIDVAAHSEMVEAILEPFGEFVGKLELKEPKVAYVSNVTGSWIGPGEATEVSYWKRHLRETVRFSEGIERLLGDGDRLLLEVGPGQSLSTLAKLQTDMRGVHKILGTMRHPHERQSDVEYLLTAVGKLWLNGVRVEWPAFYGRERRHRAPLPTYPFERQRYWIGPQKGVRKDQAVEEKKTDIADWFYIPTWKCSNPPVSLNGGPDEGRGCCLIFLDDIGLGEKIANHLKAEGREAIRVIPAKRSGQNQGDVHAINPAARNDYHTLLRELRASGKTPRTIIHAWCVTPNHRTVSDTEYFKQIQERGFYSLAFLCQALAEELANAPVDLWVVTNQLQQVESGDLTHPEKATLVALGKVVPQEYERVTCRIIDVALPPDDSRREELLTSQIVAEVNSDSPDPIIAYRGRRRWIQAFEPSRLESDKTPISRLRQNGAYLITGGLGGIGLLLAEYLAQRMQLKLALTGRSAFPARERWRQWLDTHIEEDEISRKIRKLLAIEEMGSEILVLSADAADLKQMQVAIANVHERFGEIHGVIHAAGMAGEKTVKLLSELERSQCEAQFQGKIHGLYVLEKVLQDDEVDFFILFSSNASILGGLGSLGYAAANLFMDSFAANRHYDNGRRWISVNWDGWLLSEDGRLSSSFQTSLDRYAMRPSESTEAFMRILSRANVPQIAVSTWDLSSRIEQWVTDQSRVKDISLKEKATTEFHPRPDLGIAYVSPSNQLEEKIARIWQDLLGIEQLGIHDNFFDLGGNSLIALKVISHLKKELRIEIPIVSLFEGPTVKALAQVIGQPGQKRPAYKESQERGESRRQSRRTRRKERTI